MKTIIAEKPSVAKEIASIVGARTRQDGYIEGNGYFVTWAFGHLVGLAMPEAYGFKGFNKAHLPILPQDFIIESKKIKTKDGYVPDTGVEKQLQTINKLFNDSQSIIVATDAGREGELIFRYIYNYLNCKKPFQRLWISSLTEKAIRDGLNNLKQGEAYNNLFLSAKARSEADWLIGINASQSLSISAGSGVYSLGRVQTPTLAMICLRYLENKNFKPVPYWDIKIHTHKEEISFSILSKNRIEIKEKAEEIFNNINKKDEPVQVKNVECKTINETPPLLYDLTALQKEANTKLSLTADQTLSIAQKLYESKFITYPRTGSRYISEDVFETIPELINTVVDDSMFGAYVQTLNKLNRKSVNDSKVTDHHALLITGIKPNGLSDVEMSVYNMILGRMLEAFSEQCIKDITTVDLECKNIPFIVKGVIIKSLGWRAVFNNKEESEEDNSVLPDLKAGDVLPIDKAELLTKQTKPKPLLTESSLLALMESAGKELEDEEQRAALKDAGIGTPATRAAIIETLFNRDYIKREKKTLVPTDKGLSVYDVVKEKEIANVSMTGKWENALAYIEKGNLPVERFNSEIENYTKKITEELLNTKIEVIEQELLPCPKCKEKGIKFFPKVVKCTKCDLAIFKLMAGKNLTDNQIEKLLTKKETGLIKGFKGKTGKPFDAKLIFDAEFKVTFKFDK